MSIQQRAPAAAVTATPAADQGEPEGRADRWSVPVAHVDDRGGDEQAEGCIVQCRVYEADPLGLRPSGDAEGEVHEPRQGGKHRAPGADDAQAIARFSQNWWPFAA